MNLIHFPFERVIEINTFILSTEAGHKDGIVNIPLLQGALGRIDNAIAYDGLNDVFEIAAKYADSIANAHSLPDANKRTGLMVALEYLSLNDYEITIDNVMLANAMVDLVLCEISYLDFADILYSQYISERK